MADIQPILAPLTYREVLGDKCSLPNAKVKTAFLADLKNAGAPANLLAQASAEADRIAGLDKDAAIEDVCTPELIESTATMAFAARALWSELKTRKP